ncbi:MAG TPA: hypothetical protein VHJ58_14250 [Vicinamibacterales bacterium]|nr:hypothetical protein [Vicinamibacterales bacterium]
MPTKARKCGAGPCAMMSDVDEHERPPDPDLDDLPRELAEREGPLVISGVDPEDGTHYAAYIT